MKRICMSVVLVLSVVLVVGKSFAENDFPVLTGPYFGQKLPGSTPEMFAPNLISVEGRYEFGVSFSPDLQEMYFSVLDVVDGVEGKPAIFYSQLEDQKWTRPKKLILQKV